MAGGASLDPAGTKLHIKLSEIVMRPKKPNLSAKKRRNQEENKIGNESVISDEESMKLFYSISDNGE